MLVGDFNANAASRTLQAMSERTLIIISIQIEHFAIPIHLLHYNTLYYIILYYILIFFI